MQTSAEIDCARRTLECGYNTLVFSAAEIACRLAQVTLTAALTATCIGERHRRILWHETAMLASDNEVA